MNGSRTIEAEHKGKRLDAWLAETQPELSRARWQELIRQEHVRLNDDAVKPNHKLRAGDTVSWTIPEPEPAEPQPENIPLNILFEDHDIIVISKPPGMVVHPAPGSEDGTLVNALLHHCDDLAGIGGELRPGIVHRLDKDTSGVMVVAKNETALNSLAKQFKNRETCKEYLALVRGIPNPPRGRIETQIGRSDRNRKKMAVVGENKGKHAVTNFEVLEKFAGAALVRCRIETGRTHQIRVHLTHLGHPILGDAVYGKSGRDLPAPAPRQMLHAARLEFAHPKSGEKLSFEAPLFDDMNLLLDALRKETG